MNLKQKARSLGERLKLILLILAVVFAVVFIVVLSVGYLIGSICWRLITGKRPLLEKVEPVEPAGW